MDSNEIIKVIRSRKGRDVDRYYVVIEEDDQFYYLSDGQKRGLDYLKKKRKKHTKHCGDLSLDKATWRSEYPKRPNEVKNAEIRKTLKTWKEEKE